MSAELLDQNEKPFNLAEAAEYLGISRSYLYKLTHFKQITFYKPNGKLLFFQKADLNKWLFRNKSESNLLTEVQVRAKAELELRNREAEEKSK